MANPQPEPESKPAAASATPGSGDTHIPTRQKKQYLCAVRNAPGAFQLMAAGMFEPLTTDALQKALDEDAGIDVVKRIKMSGGSTFSALSAGPAGGTSRTPDIIVTSIDPERGEALRREAASNPNLIVEEDRHLTHFGLEVLGIQNAVSSALLPTTSTSVNISFRVTGENDAPLAKATVIVWGNPPAQSETDDQGEVHLTVFGGPIGSIKAVYVKPYANYWEKYLSQPAVIEAGANVIKLRPLTETFKNFPTTGIVGWGQRAMQIDQLGPTLTGRGVKIGIIDSGCDNTHPQLTRVQSGVDITNGGDKNSWINDQFSHGTHCAGVIGAASGAVQGIRGFAPEATIVPFKVFPGGRFSDLIEALDECIKQEIDVVNCSLGSDAVSELVARKVQEALEAGVVLVFAAGNSGGSVQFPGNLPGVVSVSAIGRLNEFPPDTFHAQNILPGGIGDFFPARFSCFGPQIKLSGPGVAIISSVPGGGYAAWDGTSMAAPHITGMAALILAHHPAFLSVAKQRNLQRVTQLLHILQGVSAPAVVDVARGGAGLPQPLAALGQPPVSAGTGAVAAAAPQASTAPAPPAPTAPNVPPNALGGNVGGMAPGGYAGGMAPGAVGVTPGWGIGYGQQAADWGAAIYNQLAYRAMLFAQLRAAGLI
jgi:subtilisin